MTAQFPIIDGFDLNADLDFDREQLAEYNEKLLGQAASYRFFRRIGDPPHNFG